ncbi:nitronate monooxygenase [Grimontia kaedaensis]|uniref:Nitronate monooxygenase n=1 Tax=Grimontia kaedaensis TaxID=2872157 RepID=A0ABY4WSE2_9GAMM|nr:nitronate monooxygenase [Grimontia kaedaensis]
MEKLDFARWVDVDLPLIQAPKAGVQNSKLAIVVDEAGGLGSIPCGMLDAESVIEEIQRLQAASDKPYNLNFFCHSSFLLLVSKWSHYVLMKNRVGMISQHYDPI